MHFVAFDCERLDFQLHRDHRLEIFNGERVVRIAEQHADLIAAGLADDDLERLRIRIAELHQFLQLRPLCTGIARLDGRGQQRQVAAFAAEGELIDAAQAFQDVHGALGIGFRRAQAVGDRQLNDEVCAAPDRCFGPFKFVEHGHVAALDKVAAHQSNNMRRAVFARLFDMIKMTVMERIVFADDTADLHEIASLLSVRCVPCGALPSFRTNRARSRCILQCEMRIF